MINSVCVHLQNVNKNQCFFNQLQYFSAINHKKNLNDHHLNSRTCSDGNSTTEPYVVGHHLLLAHASAVSLYRQRLNKEDGLDSRCSSGGMSRRRGNPRMQPQLQE